MMKRGFSFSLYVALPSILSAWIFAGCGGDDGIGPVIDEIMPPAAAPGATVEIIGDRFCGDSADVVNADGSCVSPPSGLISFGEGEEAVRALGIQGWLHERITVAVPANLTPGATVVVVTVDDVASNAEAFEVE